jgi:hypothetical protein
MGALNQVRGSRRLGVLANPSYAGTYVPGISVRSRSKLSSVMPMDRRSEAMIFLNAFSFGTPEIFVGQAPTKFDEKTLELKDEITKKLVAQQLAGFAKFIERVKA